MSPRQEWSTQDLRWMEMRGPDAKRAGDIGVPEGMLLNTPRFVDGFAAQWLLAALRIDGHSGEYMSPAVVFSIPDYPSPDGRTYAMTSGDARRLGDLLKRTADTAEREAKRIQPQTPTHKTERLKKKAQKAEREALRCAEPGCTRARRFFDENAIGYCSRHADERGIRPKGKIQ